MNAFHEAFEAVLKQLPAKQQLEAVNEVEAKVRAQLDDEKFMASLHDKAFREAVEAWLEGRPIIDGIPDSAKQLSDADKADVKRLLKATKILEFSYVNDDGDLNTNCTFKIGSWSAKSHWNYNYDREYYNHHFCEEKQPRKRKYSRVKDWDLARKRSKTKLSQDKWITYFYHVAFDHLRSYPHRPSVLPHFNGAHY